MYVGFKIENDVLKITTDSEGQAELKEMGEGVQSDDVMYDVFEPVVCNGLAWVAPEDIGALTDAPILSDDSKDDDDKYPEDAKFYWYPSYQLKSPLCDLRDFGEAIFTQA